MYYYWNPPHELARFVVGMHTPNGWFGCSSLIIPCEVFQSWIVPHVDLISWTVQAYDPQHRNTTPAVKERRKKMLQPITHLLQRYLEYTRYWSHNTIRAQDPGYVMLPIEWVSDNDVYKQTDYHNGGPMACMTVERLISGRPSILWGNQNVQQYRFRIACSIFGICYTE